MSKVLILGGHGKVALHMTRILAAKNHSITSIIRDPSHAADIKATAAAADGKLVTPVVSSLEETDEQDVLRQMVGVDWVVWAAGAGGKGGPERTKAVDYQAATKYFSAAIKAPSVSKFLMISACVCRRSPAPWWDDADKAGFKHAWDVIGTYCQAKLDADEFIYDLARKTQREGFEDICLRPGTLTDEPGCGKVDLGRGRAAGGVSREDVAAVAVELLEVGGAGGLWLDLVKGEEDIKSAVRRVTTERISARD